MKAVVFSFTISCLLIFEVSSQQLFYSDIIFGGVTCGGFSTNTGFGIIETEVYVPNGSTIKKAYLLASCDGQPPDITVSLNGDNYIFNQNYMVTPTFVSGIHPSWTWSNSTIRAIDVLNSVESNSNTHTLEIPPQLNITQNGFYSSFYLFIVFENTSMDAITYNVFLNSQNVDPILQYNLNTSFPISQNADVGLGLWTTFFGDTLVDGSFVELNNTPLGLLGGSESNSPFTYTGVYANFSYSEGILIGLEDDTPNNIMAGTDGLAEISSYLNENDTSMELEFIYQSPNNIDGPYSNPVIAVFLTYTSPCQPFNASLLTSDTTVCAGVPLQLGASGGTSTGSAPPYEWLPQQNLSCYDCPNPVFLGDSTINYTVRIRNTDSCSVVYPVRVRVLPKPNFESIEITESICGGASGEILARPVSEVEPPHLFQLNGANTQLNEANYTNLAPGFYTINLTDGNACKRDSIVEIGDFNNVLADFSVNPSTGAAPLDIQISNQSQNASEYFWNFSDESGTPLYQGSGSLSGVEAPLAGLYTLTLIAGNGAEHCNDTTALQILVYDTLQLIVPNVFTPNSDGSNDWFGITANLDTELQIVLLNRWGNVILEQKVDLSANTYTPIWDGANAPDGVYFYKILLTSENKVMSGFVELRR